MLLAFSAALGLGLIAWLGIRAETRSELAKWARARGLEPIAGGYRMRIEGIPVRITPRMRTVAEARYAMGTGPVFTLRPRPLPPQPGLEARDGPSSAAQLVADLDKTYVATGDAALAMPRVRRAIELGLRDAYVYPPMFVSDGHTVSVSAFTGVELDERVERVAAIAAAMVAFDLDVLAEIADALGVPMEVDDEGLALVRVARRSTISVELHSDASGMVLALHAAIEEGAADVSAPTGDARVALEALRALGANVTTTPGRVDVRFGDVPPTDRVVRAVDALDALLAPAHAGPFR